MIKKFLEKSDRKGVEIWFMKKIMMAGLSIFLMLMPVSVWAGIPDYNESILKCEEGNIPVKIFQIDDGNGNTVNAAARSDMVSISSKTAYIRSNPGNNGKELRELYLGTQVERVAVCDNGWSKVVYERTGKEKVIGYISTEEINDNDRIKTAKGTFQALSDSNILDYPGRKDGEIVGEILQQDKVKRIRTINKIWSQIYYTRKDGSEDIGYIPTSVLEKNVSPESEAQENEIVEVDGEKAGVIHKSNGTGIFAEAVDGVTAPRDKAVDGVQVGTPVAVSSDAVLKPLGTFRITHYCPCSICCGPWANGITATGKTAVTNHTIAVDPTQIPYGSKVVINGQVYVAEDCGGAIKRNCIDIYVATHAEGESKGVYYTEVYLLE